MHVLILLTPTKWLTIKFFFSRFLLKFIVYSTGIMDTCMGAERCFLPSNIFEHRIKLIKEWKCWIENNFLNKKKKKKITKFKDIIIVEKETQEEHFSSSLTYWYFQSTWIVEKGDFYYKFVPTVYTAIDFKVIKNSRNDVSCCQVVIYVVYLNCMEVNSLFLLCCGCLMDWIISSWSLILDLCRNFRQN